MAHVERLARLGILTKVHIGKRGVRFRSDDVEAFIEVYSGDPPRQGQTHPDSPV